MKHRRPTVLSRAGILCGCVALAAALVAGPLLAGKPVCGDGVCQGNESKTCPQDCPAPPPPPPPPPSDDHLLHVFDNPDGGAFGEFAVLSLDLAPGSPGREIVIGNPKFNPGKGGKTARTGKVLGYSGPTATPPYALLFEIVGPEGRSQFGYSVAPAGDFNGDGAQDLAVTAFETDVVYVYSGADGDGDGLPDLDLWFSTPGGKGLASAGDLTGDGCDELIIGEPAPASSQPGVVEVWSGFDSDPASGCQDGPTLHLDLTDGVASGRFGEDVAGGSDLDGDGTPDIVVGARDANGTGGVYVYSGFDGTPLYPPVYGVNPGDQAFGVRVALLPDVTADFVDDVIVGARNSDNPATGEEGGGAVYVLDGATGAPTFFEAFGEAGDQLGSDVSSAGDLDGDGLADVLAGARQHGPASNGRFVAYSSLTGDELLSRVGPDSSSLGSAVSGGFDLDGDGTPDILVAAPGADAGGKVYLYSGVPEP